MGAVVSSGKVVRAMMRNVNVHQFYPSAYSTGVSQGTIRSERVNGVDTTWAVARPVSAPMPTYSPPAPTSRGSGAGFSPSQPNVVLDPSNQQTLHCPYPLTNSDTS